MLPTSQSIIDSKVAAGGGNIIGGGLTIPGFGNAKNNNKNDDLGVGKSVVDNYKRYQQLGAGGVGGVASSSGIGGLATNGSGGVFKRTPTRITETAPLEGVANRLQRARTGKVIGEAGS